MNYTQDNVLNNSTLYPQKLALTSPTSGGRSVGVVHSGHGVYRKNE
jgi:hypothetical protein